MRPQSMSLRLELFVRDMEASITFYCHILGFEVQRRLTTPACAAAASCLDWVPPQSYLSARAISPNISCSAIRALAWKSS